MHRRVPHATVSAGALALLLLVGTGFARAGSICGTVRDGTTLQSVPNAAVFLFDDDYVAAGARGRRREARVFRETPTDSRNRFTLRGPRA